MHISNCPVCNSSSLADVMNCKDYTTTGEIFTIQKCSSCGFLLTNPRPENDQLGKYYESDQYISHTNSKKGIFSTVYQMVRNYAIKQKFNLVASNSKGKNHLDYGCGTGEFLSYVKSQGWNTIGIEPSDAARNQAISNHKLDARPLSEFSNLTAESFNSISLWHVLEHVPDLNETLAKFNQLLANDGLLVIAVPNPTSPDAQKYGNIWAGYDVPRHLWHFSPDVMKKLVEGHGFKLISMKPMVFDAFYVSLLSEKYKSGSMNPISAFFSGLKTTLKASGKPQHSSSVIYLFRK